MADTKVQQVAIERAVQLLNASGAKFKVIWYDKEYGDLEVKTLKPVKEKGNRTKLAEAEGRKYGDLKAHYWPMVKDMKVGDVVTVPFANFRRGTLQKALSSGLCHMWGAGSNMCVLGNAGIEVMRVK